MSAYVTAYEHFNEHRSILKMTTGSANLDSLIDSIQEGQFYLFYGSNKTVFDGLVHGLLVNCAKQKHGFESMVLYINNTDYYQPDKSKVFLGESSIDKEIGNGELKVQGKKEALGLPDLIKLSGSILEPY